jgi:hypothetical protein
MSAHGYAPAWFLKREKYFACLLKTFKLFCCTETDKKRRCPVRKRHTAYAVPENPGKSRSSGSRSESAGVELLRFILS